MNLEKQSLLCRAVDLESKESLNQRESSGETLNRIEEEKVVNHRDILLTIENQEHDLRSMTQRCQAQDYDKNIFMLQMSSIYFDRNQ